MDDTPRITDLRKKLEKDPASRVFAQLAEELRKDGRLDEAVEVGRRGLEGHPNYPSARLTVARALLDSGRAAEARPDLEQVVRAAPDNILASRLLGEALEELGEAAQAVQQFEQTLQLAPGDKALIDRIGELKTRISQAEAVSEPSDRPPALEVAAAAALPPAAPDPVLVPASSEEPLPAVLAPETPSASPTAQALPSAAPEEALPALPEVALPPAPIDGSVDEPAEASPEPGVALDRDLASGTFSPGTLKVADLQDHFDRAAAEDTGALPALPPSPPDPVGPLPVVAAPEAPAPDELPSVDVPPDDADVGASTLPLNSLTLADLYLQQGLKAEASAVLSQVLKEEPGNAEARSRLATVSAALDQAPPEAPAVDVPTGEPGTSSSPPPDASVALSAHGSGGVETRSLSREEIRDKSISSLEAFLSAVEREALHQQAAGRGAF